MAEWRVLLNPQGNPAYDEHQRRFEKIEGIEQTVDYYRYGETWVSNMEAVRDPDGNILHRVEVSRPPEG